MMLCVFFSNWSGVCHVPTKISSLEFGNWSPSWYPLLREEGMNFWRACSWVWGGIQWRVANSGINWSRFLCCRCWNARVLTLGFGGGVNKKFWQLKPFGWPMQRVASAVLGMPLHWMCQKSRSHCRHGLGMASACDHFGKLQLRIGKHREWITSALLALVQAASWS